LRAAALLFVMLTALTTAQSHHCPSGSDPAYPQQHVVLRHLMLGHLTTHAFTFHTLPPGSSLERTANIQKVLRDVISRYNITSMLDSSCGSMFWMPLALQEVEAQKPDFRFMGTDVVCSLIDKHKTNFINHTNWKFDCVDYASQPLPSGYDLVFSRDSLQHVPLHAVWQFLNNVRNSGARWLLVGSYVKSPDPNKVITPGDFYKVDLLKPPFSANRPVEMFDEQDGEKKHMLLFDVTRMTWQDSLQGIL
jgi:hypothetical protein